MQYFPELIYIFELSKSICRSKWIYLTISDCSCQHLVFAYFLFCDLNYLLDLTKNNFLINVLYWHMKIYISRSRKTLLLVKVYKLTWSNYHLCHLHLNEKILNKEIKLFNLGNERVTKFKVYFNFSDLIL